MDDFCVCFSQKEGSTWRKTRDEKMPANKNPVGRPAGKRKPNSRKKATYYENAEEKERLKSLAAVLGISAGACIRFAVKRLHDEQKRLRLSKDALQAIEDIRTVDGLESRSEAITAALISYRAECVARTINKRLDGTTERKNEAMGLNLRTCCHRCKQKVFHLRGKENKTLLPFYKKHSKCMNISPSNVETLEDQYQEADWMRDDGYVEVNTNGGDED
jgi:hypothetical protein